jgi:hypothetical protein
VRWKALTLSMREYTEHAHLLAAVAAAAAAALSRHMSGLPPLAAATAVGTAAAGHLG